MRSRQGIKGETLFFLLLFDLEYLIKIKKYLHFEGKTSKLVETGPADTRMRDRVSGVVCHTNIKGEKSMKKRFPAIILTLLSTLLLALPCVQTASAAQGDYIAANHTRSNGQPYYIMVNRAQSTVTVYGLDSSGYYTVPVKAMICSTGRQGHATPTGTYTIGGKWQWVHMLDNSYGQYVSQISGNILFHSVCYYKKDPSTLITEEYNGLGAPASLGCVRLQTVDAKWIYDNCARGTKITVYDGTTPGPLGKPARVVDYIAPEQANGWDPTDPRAENPWHAILAAAQKLYYDDAMAWAVENGIISAATFSPDEICTQAQVLNFLWSAAGRPENEAYQCATVWAASKGMIRLDNFDPGTPCTRAAAVRFIWQAFNSPKAGAVSFTDVRADSAFAAAVAWAVRNKITNGTASTAFSPYENCTQAQILTFLYRAYQK